MAPKATHKYRGFLPVAIGVAAVTALTLTVLNPNRTQASGVNTRRITVKAVRPTTPPPPACFTSTAYEPAPAPPAALTGRLGLYVARFDAADTTFQPVRAVARNATGVFPLASTFKQAVLLALTRQVDAGRVRLDERFDVTRANQSLGSYPYDGTTALDLARRMIQHSDNTATDILFRRIGLDALQPQADALHLCHTRLQLPTKAWWAAEAGLGGPDFPPLKLLDASRKFATADPQTRLAIAQRLDTAAQSVGAEQLRHALDPYFAGRNGGPATMSEIDRNLQNATTPLEWARFMHHEFTSNGLTPAMNATFRDVMALGYGKNRIRTPFTYFGGKAGNTAHILTLSGYLETPAGDRVIYAFMNDSNRDIDTFALAPTAFTWINAAINEVLR